MEIKEYRNKNIQISFPLNEKEEVSMFASKVGIDFTFIDRKTKKILSNRLWRWNSSEYLETFFRIEQA